MRVTLLGTGAAEGWPGLFCRCAACVQARVLGGKNIRTRSSALLDGVLKIDFPPDILHQVITNDLDLCSLKALLFTHAHDDHFSGAELQYLGPYFVTERLAQPLPVYGPPEVITWLQNNLNLERLPLTLHTLRAGQMECIEGYHVTPLLAQHDPTQTCFNYIIEDKQGATLLYATDTGWYEDATWQFLQGFVLDGIVAECQKGPTEDGYQGHLSLADIVRMREKLIGGGSFGPDKPFAVTHLSHLTGLMHTEWETRLAPHHILTGYDGMTFDVPPPTPSERRRRLNSKHSV